SSAASSSIGVPVRDAAAARPLYINPVLMYGTPRILARRRDNVVLPLPAAPSTATSTRSVVTVVPVPRPPDGASQRTRGSSRPRPPRRRSDTTSALPTRRPSAPSRSGGHRLRLLDRPRDLHPRSRDRSLRRRRFLRAHGSRSRSHRGGRSPSRGARRPRGTTSPRSRAPPEPRAPVPRQ